MENLIVVDTSNIDCEHICCAISDKKSKEGYEKKKAWLKREFDNGYVFRRIDARAKAFIEYGPAEKGWTPLVAPDFLLINCFWVAGQYKGQGYGKELLRLAVKDACDQGKNGLVTVAGISKFHFMSDTKWLMRQGFEMIEKTSSGFCLLMLKWQDCPLPYFCESVKSGECPDKQGLVAYYSDRCPFTQYNVNIVLRETAAKKSIPLKIIKIETLQQAQSVPSPATIFSLFYQGKFVTTDISVCLESRFEKIIK